MPMSGDNTGINYMEVEQNMDVGNSEVQKQSQFAQPQQTQFNQYSVANGNDRFQQVDELNIEQSSGEERRFFKAKRLREAK